MALSTTGPLLFSDNETLDPETRDEIDRVLEPGDEILLLGGSVDEPPSAPSSPN